MMASSASGEAQVKLQVESVSEDDNNNKEKTLLQFEYNKLSLEEFIKEWNARVERRSALYEKNLGAHYDEFEKLVKAKKLDSNLKKCTAFVRKMRQFQESYKASLESDVRTLNLTKYISEIAFVVVELRVKAVDIPSLISVCSEIHARYRDFSVELLNNFKNVLAEAKLEKDSKVTIDFRVFIELFLAGILKSNESFDLLIQTIQNLISSDKDGSYLVPALTTIFRDVTDELIGVVPRDVRLALEDHVCQTQLKRSTGFGLKDDDKQKLRGVLKKYFHFVKVNFSKKNDKVWGSAKYIRKLLETKGEVPPDRQKSHDELASQLEKLYSHISKFANLLDVQTPKLRYLSTNPDEEFDRALMKVGEGGEGLEGVFEDEETRQFYQELPDLVAYMYEKKNGLLKHCRRNSCSAGSESLENGTESCDKNGNVKENEEVEESDDDEETSGDDSDSSLGVDELEYDSEEELDSEIENFDVDLEKAELMQENEEVPPDPDLDGDTLPSMRDDKASVSGGCSNEDVSVPSGQSKVNFLAYLSNLKNCVNKAMIDNAAYEFVDNFKSRKCRLELAKHLFSLPRQRMDLLRLFSRLAATVSQIYPEVGQEICELLRKDFRFLVLKRDQQRLDSKLRVTRFIAELTMFSVFPKIEAFNCLKMLLRNFTHHQIEMTVCFLETCGRFLYRSQDSHRRMKLYLEEMLRRKSCQFLEPCYAYKVDCAYNQLCSPREGPVPKKVKPPLQAYLEYVLCYDLNRDTLERANKVLRMFDWQNHSKMEMAVNILSSPWRLNYSQLDTAAALLASINQFRPSVSQAVVENISEVFRLGCEFESEDLNNMRMSVCQYLAHLYNYKCISTTSLLNVMYYLISYGVTYKDNLFSTMDPPDSLYRVRVICYMLRIVGDFVSTPKSNRRLDFFLKYFQRYYLYKKGLSVWEENAGRKRFPHYVEEMFEDTIKRVRRKWKFVQTMEEAEQDILELDKKLREKVKNDEIKKTISGERSSIGVKVPVGAQRNMVATNHGAATVDKPVNYAKAASTQNNCSQQTRKTRLAEPKSFVLDPLEEESENEEDEFEKELRAMLLDRGTAALPEKVLSNGSRHNKTDLPIAKAAVGSGESGMTALNYGLPKVKVTLLTKQNNKPKEKILEVEPTQDFLMSIKEREEQEKRELQEVKTRTLQLSQRQQEEEQIEKQKSMMESLRMFATITFTKESNGRRAQSSLKK